MPKFKECAIKTPPHSLGDSHLNTTTNMAQIWKVASYNIADPQPPRGRDRLASPPSTTAATRTLTCLKAPP